MMTQELVLSSALRSLKFTTCVRMLFNQTPKDLPHCPHSSMLTDLPSDYEQYFLL